MLTATLANVLDMQGPEFLRFYLVATVIGFVLAGVVRYWLAARRQEHPWAKPADPDQLDPYQAAYVEDGRIRTVNAALASLIARGKLVPDHKKATVSPSEDRTPSAEPLHPLERAVLDAARSGMATRISDIRAAVASQVKSIAEEVVTAGLVVPPSAAAAARLLGVLIGLAAPVLGVVKIILGIQRDRPVGILVFFVIVSTLLALFVWGRRVHTTAAGRRAIRNLRVEHEQARYVDSAPSPQEAVAWGVALFGTAALAGTAWADLRTTLTPPASTSSGGACGTGCGGGGGGGCGGGGDGSGGGCGGCGGGD